MTACSTRRCRSCSAEMVAIDRRDDPCASEIVEVTGARHALGSKTLDVPVLAVDRDARVAAVTGPVGRASR